MFISDLIKEEITKVKSYRGQIHLITCVSLSYDLNLLSHFMKYYHHLGVDVSYIILHSPCHPPPLLMQQAKEIISSYTAKDYQWNNYYHGVIRQQMANSIIANSITMDSWVISADIDEFQEYPVSLKKVIGYMEKKKFNVLYGMYFDRVSRDGSLPSITGKENLSCLFITDYNLKSPYF